MSFEMVCFEEAHLELKVVEEWVFVKIDIYTLGAI